MKVTFLSWVAAALVLLPSLVMGTEAEDYYQQGLQAVQSIQVNTAERAFARAIHVDENFLPAYKALASLYSSVRRYREGLTILEQAEAIDPDDAELWSQKAWLYECVSEPDNAQHAYEKALALAPNDVRILESAGRFYAERGDIATSEELSVRREALMEMVTP